MVMSGCTSNNLQTNLHLVGSKQRSLKTTTGHWIQLLIKLYLYCGQLKDVCKLLGKLKPQHRSNDYDSERCHHCDSAMQLSPALNNIFVYSTHWFNLQQRAAVIEVYFDKTTVNYMPSTKQHTEKKVSNYFLTVSIDSYLSRQFHGELQKRWEKTLHAFAVRMLMFLCVF